MEGKVEGEVEGEVKVVKSGIGKEGKETEREMRRTACRELVPGHLGTVRSSLFILMGTERIDGWMGEWTNGWMDYHYLTLTLMVSSSDYCLRSNHLRIAVFQSIIFRYCLRIAVFGVPSPLCVNSLSLSLSLRFPPP